MADVYNISVARLVSIGSIDGQRVSNVTYWEKGNDIPLWTAETLMDLCEQYALWLTDSLMPLLTDAYEVSQIQATQMKADGALQATYTPVAAIEGGSASPRLPNNVAACATINTGLAGKSYRGRFYIAGLTEDMNAGSYLTDGAAALLNGAMNDLVTAEAFTNYTIGVYSKITGGAPRLAGLFTPATSIGLKDKVLDSQRRRLPGRGV